METKKDFQLGPKNPANLRWHYMIKGLLSEEPSLLQPEDKHTLQNCLTSLAKYPLVIATLEQCTILQHFTPKILAILQGQEPTSHSAEPFDELSPIPKKTQQHASSTVVDLTGDDDESESRPYVAQEDAREQTTLQNIIDQEEADFQLALRLSQMQEEPQTNTTNGHQRLTNSFRHFENDDSLALPLGMEESLPSTSISPLKDLDDSNISGVSGIRLPKKNAFGTPPSKAKRGKKNKGPSKAAKENLPKEPKPSSSQKQQHPAKSTAVHAISSSDDDDVRATGSTSLSQPIKSTGNKKSNDPIKAMFKNDPVFGGRGRRSMSQPSPATSARSKSKRKKIDDVSMNLELSDDDDNSVSSNNRSRKPRKTPKKKDYLPKPGTAGYAIMMALFNKSQDPGFVGYMTKDELIRAAQPMADCDMRRPAVGKEYYCGWSTSTTLERKGLIEMWSNPKKIRLTESGRQLALKIKANQIEAQQEVNGGPAIEAATAEANDFDDDASWLKEVNSFTTATSAQADPSSSSASFSYCYVNEEGQETSDQNQAEVDIGQGGVFYLVKCIKDHLLKHGKRHVFPPAAKKSQLEGGLCVAFLHESECQEVSPLSDTKHWTRKPAKPMPTIRLEVKSSPMKRTKTTAKGQQHQQPTIDSSELVLARLPANVGGVDIPAAPRRQPENENDHLVLSPNDYRVVLVVDAMEVTGGGAGGKKSRKNLTLEELDDLQVRYETRKLSIGDFVWIAKSHKGDLVLPYVVERKRMDDLRSSIMDGRYKEQKTRLSHCGLPRKFYLIEETATSGGREAWQGHSNQASGGQALNRESLEQAISNTCVRDGFTVRRCRSPKECVEFLAALTDVLTQKYSGKRLHKRKLMEPHHPDDCHLPTLTEFHEFSRTDKPLVIREIFCNMLVTMKGLSPGMAWAITDKYPTPALLKEGYDMCQSDEDRESLLSGLYYDGGKKLPKAVSKAVSWLYNDRLLN